MDMNTEITAVMMLSNEQLPKVMKMAERKMNETKDMTVFEASFHLYEDAKKEMRRRDD